jgi:N-acyl-D-amino-acid deacylase
LVRVAGKNQKIVAVHQRSDGDQSISSVEEIIDYAALTGARIQISHLSSMCSFGSMEEAISLIDSSRSNGLDVGFDGYPYYAFCTTIGSAVFDEGFLDKYRYGDEYFVADLLNAAEVDRCITHPASVVVSDGLYSNGQGHPRGSGTFPKLIREYVVEKKLLSLEDAVEKITWLPAKRIGLLGKGSLKIGSDADITVFDLSEIRDGATYQEPRRAPQGIEYAVIGGVTAMKHGEIIHRRLGKSIRK